MARRRKESAVEALFGMSWWVSGALAGIAFFSPTIIKLVYPDGSGQLGSAIKQGFVTTAESFSPYITGFLLFVAVIILIKDTYKNRKITASTTNRNKPAQNIQVTPLGKSQLDITISDMMAEKAESRTQTVPALTSWSLELLQSIEWKRFEELCEALFKELNLIACNTKFGADGGVDIELYAKESPDTLVAIAQCKAWSNPVGVKEIRAFYGVMVTSKVSRAYFVTTSSFTRDAIKFSELSEVTLINGKQLLKLISSRSPEKSDKLLKLATAGDYTTPTCPGCGLKMVTRKSSSGNQFWGCTSYPRCKGKLNMKRGK